MRERLARFMAGRNGNDQLNNFLLILEMILILLSIFIPGRVGKYLYIVVLALLVYIYFRMFSRNITKRREDNGKYIRLRYRIVAAYRVRRERWVQRKDYKFFTCPSCRTALRVPRGKGQIRIVCRKCGNTFTGKT